jgi:hypothetical protein
MGRLALRDLIVRLWLDGMHEVRELHRILNEEDGNVVADDIPVALVRVEFGRESTNITDRVLKKKKKITIARGGRKTRSA